MRERGRTHFALSTTVTGTGPGLLVLHGAGGSVRANYGPALGELSARFSVIAPDLPGSGASPRSTGALDLDALADAVVGSAVGAGHETFAISGYSMGAALAIRAALRHPERVTAMVLTGGFAKLDGTSSAKTEKWLKLLAGPRDNLGWYVLSLMLSERYFSALAPDHAAALAELAGLSMAPGAEDHVRLLQTVDLTTEELSRLTAPTLVLGLALDRMVSPRLSGQLAARIPGGSYREIDCGHAVGLERPRAWVGELVRFLGDPEHAGLSEERKAVA